MKVLFIQQNGLQESLGIANISALLKSSRHECSLILLSHTPDLIEAIRTESPQLIALSALTGVHTSLLELASRIKKTFKIPIIMGGPHATFCPDVIEYPAIDIICRGEGELAVQELADRLDAGKDIRHIQNLYVKDSDGVVHKNPLRPPVDLDTLPLPDRELYYKYHFLRDMPMKRFITSMGCPYHCTFCHEPVIFKMYKGKYLRRKSVERVIQEIRYIKDRYPLKMVHFSDDLFLTRDNTAWLEDFALRYPKDIGIPFCCNLRYDSITEPATVLLKKALCYGAAIGLESGNEHLREVVMQKKVKNEHMLEGAALLRQYRIKTLTTNLIGLPGETLDEAFETVSLNRQLKSHYTRANTFLLFDGLPLVDYAREHGYLDENYDVQKHKATALELIFKSPYHKEFRNLSYLFWIFVHLPQRWQPYFKKIVSWPDNVLFRLLGTFNLLQEIRFYKVPFFSGLRYYYHTVIRSKDIMTFRNLPSLKKQRQRLDLTVCEQSPQETAKDASSHRSKSFFSNLKWKIKNLLEGHPYGFLLGKALIPYMPFMLPHESNYLGLPSLMKNSSGLILDIGANDGISARYFCRINPDWEVFSIEANPIHEKALQKIKAKHHNFEFKIAATSDQDVGSLKLYTPFYRSIALHTATSINREVAVKNMMSWKSLAGFSDQIKYHETVTPTITVDSLGLHPQIVKIDTEGSELATLKGMTQTIKRARPIFLIELGDDSAAMQFLLNFDYQVFSYDSQKRQFRQTATRDERGSFFFPKEKCPSLPMANTVK